MNFTYYTFFLLHWYCKSACLSSFAYELFSCRHRLFVANNKTGGVRGKRFVEALRYKPEGRGLDTRWGRWDFSLL